jgi:hypothetical protein
VVLSLSGDVALARKQYAKAYVRYRRALFLNPDLADAHTGSRRSCEFSAKLTQPISRKRRQVNSA